MCTCSAICLCRVRLLQSATDLSSPQLGPLNRPPPSALLNHRPASRTPIRIHRSQARSSSLYHPFESYHGPLRSQQRGVRRQCSFMVPKSRVAVNAQSHAGCEFSSHLLLTSEAVQLSTSTTPIVCYYTSTSPASCISSLAIVDDSYCRLGVVHIKLLSRPPFLSLLFINTFTLRHTYSSALRSTHHQPTSQSSDFSYSLLESSVPAT